MEVELDPQLLLGPMLLGTYLNTIAFGVLLVQSFIYYQTYRNDKAWIRYLLLYLFVAETVNTGINIGMMYEALVLRFGTMRALTRSPVMLSGNAIVTVLISTPVQLFIAWRIMVISGSRLITAIISVCALGSLAGGIAVSSFVTAKPDFRSFHDFAGAVITWLVSCAIADVVITFTLVFSLYRRKTGFRATDDAINRIIRLTVQTGMLTAIVAAAVVIMYLSTPGTTLMFIPDFALSKLYTNSLLSTLNARAGWKNLSSPRHHNPLFVDGDDHTVTRTAKSNNTNARTTVVTGVLELEPRSVSGHEGDHETDASFVEGIKVARVVERFEDPFPNTKVGST